MARPTLGGKLRLGLLVFAALVVVEVIEFLVGWGLRSGATVYLVILAVPGAGLIVWYFMHLHQLWRRGEE